MWVVAIVAVLVLAWLVWWLRHPHHHRSGGRRSRDGRVISRYFTIGDDEGEHPPTDQVQPGEYGGD